MMKPIYSSGHEKHKVPVFGCMGCIAKRGKLRKRRLRGVPSGGGMCDDVIPAPKKPESIVLSAPDSCFGEEDD